MTDPTSGPFETPPPPPSGPWVSDNLPPHPMSGYQPEPVEQPATIANAVKLMYVGAAVGVISTIVTITQLSSIRDTIEDDNPSFTASEVDLAVTFAVATTVAGGLIGLALWIWMAVKNGQGRSWARVVATVFGALNVAFTLLGMAGGVTALGLVFSIVSLALAGVILYLLYRPESSRFYDFRSRT